ncbi:MAG: ABC transporter permease subunit [Thermofilum sp.]
MRLHELKRAVLDKLFHAAAASASAALLAVSAHIIAASVVEGLPALLAAGPALFVEPPGLPGGELGGLGPVLAGTLVIVSLSVLMSALIGVPAGILLSEYGGSWLARSAGAALQMISEIPSVVVGLVVFTLLVLPMRTPSALAAAVSLCITALPYVAAQTRESLAAIPLTYREAAFSLGLPRWKAVLMLLVPMNARGVATAVLLGAARSLGETAPVLFTAGAAFTAFYGLTGPSSTLSLLIFYFAPSPYENWRRLAWAAVLLLVALTAALSLAVRRLSRGVRM